MVEAEGRSRGGVRIASICAISLEEGGCLLSARESVGPDVRDGKLSKRLAAELLDADIRSKI